MEAPSTSTGSLSSDSSASSLAEDALKTPFDGTNHSPPGSFVESKMEINMLSSRLEMVPKRAFTTPSTHWIQAPQHETSPGPTILQMRPSGRVRRDTNASISSTLSTASNNSLLRATLLLATSSSSRPRPHSLSISSATTYVATPTGTGSTPSLLTSRASSSSLASTTLSNLPSKPTAPALFRRDPPSPSANHAKLSSSQLSLNASLAAEATTAISPTTSPSLAQFSPTANATSSLLRYGISTNTTASRQSNLGTGVKTEVRRRRSRDRRASTQDDHSRSNLLLRRHNGNVYDDDDVDVLKRRTNDLPSISRALEPDDKLASIWAVGVAGTGGVDAHTISNTNRDVGIDVPVSMPYHYDSGLTASNSRDEQGTRDFVAGRGLPGTPRPAFPIQEPHRSSSSPPPSSKPAFAPVSKISALDKGKGRAATMPLPRASSDTRALTKTHFSHLLPGAKSQSKQPSQARCDLPSLAAIESSSRLMRSKIVCSTCGDVGPDFPRCGRCGEAWCSRDCRMRSASASETGKHRCPGV